ncbi:MAG TPA: hypothetical protein VL523_19435 [Terriglobia bacterium]|nr:hypothetical protein [Terriglobia bacterium]
MTKHAAAIALMAVLQGRAAAQTNPPELAHTRTEAHLTLNVPYEVAAPLFGPLAEEQWSPDWKPRFLYPNPPADREGAVFEVDFSPTHQSVWTMTQYDLAGGHIQYVFTISHAVLTRIDITLARSSAGGTDVTVVHERTALDPGVNAAVQKMAKSDAEQVAEWKAPIEAWATKSKAAASRP